MPKKINYYHVLGVSITSTSAEIKQSFRRLAVKYHPDRNKKDKDSGDKFKEIRRAYEVLIDAEKRSAYDSLKASGAGVDSKDSKYKGERKGGKEHGQRTYSGGAKYKGERKDGKYHGQGTYTYGPNSEWAGDKYVGESKDNKWHGQGTYTYGPNSEWAGDKYVGEFKDGKWHGQGTYTYADGRKYVGEWKNGKWHR